MRERRAIHRLLSEFFHEHKISKFNKAVTEICRFYRLRKPKVEWFEYLDWGRTAGRTYENGKVHLVHPENWKRGRKYNTEWQWINTVFHEMGHYILWTDAEVKADLFATKMESDVANGGRYPARSVGMTRSSKRAA